jgi:general stress protein 26
MANYTLATMARHMRQLDICMMVTQSGRGILSSRPMSNNGDVKYDGSSYFFTFEGSQKIKDIEASPQINLNFEGKNDLYLSITGKAKLIRNKAMFAEHWVDSLQQWFKEGIETKGMVLIHVKGEQLHYWQKNKEGKIKL